VLPRLPGAIGRPAYDRSRLGVGIVHLGLGAFHRAHQAAYTDDALAREFGPWGICGVSLRGVAVRDQLAPQDCLYTLVERSAAGERLAVIGAVREVLYAPDDPAVVAARIADPAVRIVSLTVTEKGYCHDPATGLLNHGHPDIAHDLAEPVRPRSTVGMLCAGLAARRRRGAGPVTVLCCDNLPHNGRMLAGIVRSFAEAQGGGLGDWIGANASFPCTMVDRIVPATTDRDRDGAARALGCRDEGAVVAEPFRQWVIEDAFAAGRPAWERAGAEIVADVAPYETMKLRLLNGSHSALAYLGFLAGHDYIHQVMADPPFPRFMGALMDREVGPTLSVPAGVDLAGYKRSLVERFANPALGHRTRQIAMDGSQKLPQRLLGTVRDRLARGQPVHLLGLAVAAWMRYVAGTDERGQPIEVADPLAPELSRIARAAAGQPAALLDGLLQVKAVFGADLPAVPEFRAAVGAALDSLMTRGARATLDAMVAR
jgi:fructuronate reductase